MLFNGKCSWSYKSLTTVKSCQEDSGEPNEPSAIHIQRSETSISCSEKKVRKEDDEISFEESSTVKNGTETCHLKNESHNTADNSTNKNFQGLLYDFGEIEQTTSKNMRKKTKNVRKKKIQIKSETPNRTARLLRNREVVNYADIDLDSDSSKGKMKTSPNKYDDEGEEFICNLNDENNSDNSDEELVFQTRFSDKNANLIDITNSIESNSYEEETGTKGRTTVSPIIVKFNNTFETDGQRLPLGNSPLTNEENTPSASPKISQNKHADKNFMNDGCSVSSIDEQEKEVVNRNKSISRTICSDTKYDYDKFNSKSELDENSFESKAPISPMGLLGKETLQLDDVFEERIDQNSSESNGLGNSCTFSEEFDEIKVIAKENIDGNRQKNNYGEPNKLDSKKVTNKNFAEQDDEISMFTSKNEFSNDKTSEKKNSKLNKIRNKVQTSANKGNECSYNSQETSLDTATFNDETSATKFDFQSSNKTFWDDYFNEKDTKKASVKKWNVSEESKKSELENVEFNNKELHYPKKESTSKEKGRGSLKQKSNQKITKKRPAAKNDRIWKKAASTVSRESDASNKTVHLDSEGNIRNEKKPQPERTPKRKKTITKHELDDCNLNDSFNMENRWGSSIQSLKQDESYIGYNGVVEKLEEKLTNKRKKRKQEEDTSEMIFLQENNSTLKSRNKKSNATYESERNVIQLEKKPKTWEDLESSLLKEMDNNIITNSAECNFITIENISPKTNDIVPIAEATPKRKDITWKKEFNFKSNGINYSSMESSWPYKQSTSKNEMLLFDDIYFKKDVACTDPSQNLAVSSPSLSIINKTIAAMSKCTDEYLSNNKGNIKDNWMEYHKIEATNTEYSFSVQSTFIHASRNKLSMAEKTSKSFHDEEESTPKLNNSDGHLENEKTISHINSFDFSNETLNTENASPDVNLSSRKPYSLRNQNKKANLTIINDTKSTQKKITETQKKIQQNISKFKIKQPKRNGRNKTDDSKLFFKNNESGKLTAGQNGNYSFSSYTSSLTQNGQELSDDALDFDLKMVWERPTTKATCIQLPHESPKSDKNIRLKTIKTNKNIKKMKELPFNQKEEDSLEENKIAKTALLKKAVNSKEIQKPGTKDVKKETSKDRYIKYLKNLFKNDCSNEENSNASPRKVNSQHCEQENEENIQSTKIKFLIKDEDLFSTSSEDSDTDENQHCSKEGPLQSSGLLFETLDEIS